MAVSPATRSPAASDLIVVDGVARPRENSVGRLIHHTEDGIRNFWRWFGDSRVVDEAGRPAVVYHGTRSDVEFTAFDKEHGNPCNSGGHYFSSDRQFAAKFGTVKEFYLRITNPLLDGFNGSGAVMYSSEHRDGGIFTKRNTDHYAKKGTKEYIVFDPAQIKSATHNSGAFSPDSVHFCDNEMPHDAAPTSPAGPPTIMVDGIARPRTNSAGQPIHNTEDGIRNFWRWFGNSHAVDASTGAPVVAFHGTGNSFRRFARHAYTEREGFYFTTDPDMATDFAENAADGIDYCDDEEAGGPLIMPVYLSIMNPVDVRCGWPPAVAEQLDDVINYEWLTTLPPGDFWLAMDGDEGNAIRTKLEALGYDGLLASELGKPVFVAFQAGQVKSALGNSGIFDPSSPCLCDHAPRIPSMGLREQLQAMDQLLATPAATSGPSPV